MTRLGSANVYDSHILSRSFFYFPLVGITLGFCLLIPSFLSFFSNFPFVQSWIYVSLSLWLTRAFHLDGLADVIDAAGSGKSGKDFFLILKDSRIGVFGSLGITLTISGWIIVVEVCFAQNITAPLLWAPVWGRCLPVLFTAFAPQNAESFLGKLTTDASLPLTRVASLSFGILSGVAFVGLKSLLLTILLSIILFYIARQLAYRAGGYNGDFFGFIIIFGELSVLLSCLA